MTFDLVNVNQGSRYNSNNGIVTIATSGYYYLYISAGAAQRQVDPVLSTPPRGRVVQKTTSDDRGWIFTFPFPPIPELLFVKFFFFVRVVQLWNKLPQEVVSASSVSAFISRPNSMHVTHVSLFTVLF